jgi:phospholipid transport system substrate-binding protein
MKRLSVVFFLWLALWLPAAQAQAQTPPDELVRTTTEEILRLLKTNREAYQRDKSALYAMVDKEVLPHFDFQRMSQWVLGRHWRTATPAQRERFVKEFRDLLVRTYATALLNYRDEKVIYLPFTGKPDDRQVIVRTEIKQSSGAPNIPISYSFYNKGSAEWKVYDVSIEGVSLVTNYRTTYADKIRRDGLDALIASISKTSTQNVLPDKGPEKGKSSRE